VELNQVNAKPTGRIEMHGVKDIYHRKLSILAIICRLKPEAWSQAVRAWTNILVALSSA